MWAAQRGDIDLVEQLVSAGADVNAKDKDGKSVGDHAPSEVRDRILTVLAHPGKPQGAWWNVGRWFRE
jgi:ankyrin repeat protein